MTRLLVVDDHPIFRDGLAGLLATLPDLDDVRTAGSARGYVLKDATADEILAAVRTVAAGGAVFGAAVATRILANRPTRAGARPSLRPAEALTTREQDVLSLLADGATNRQIARSLGLSLKTVQNHVSRILDKLQAADRTQAVLRARGINT